MHFALRRLYLVRHGETDWNREGRLQGLIDSALNDIGRAQARALADRLAQTQYDALYTSPLLRAVETAEALGEMLKRTPIVLHGLRERDVGAWGGMTYSEVREKHPEEWARTKTGEDVAIGGGESKARVQARMFDALDQIARAHPGGDVVVVSHGFAIRMLVCGLLRLPLEHSDRMTTGGNASVTVFEARDGLPHLKVFADASHVDGAVTSWTGVS